MSSVTGQSLTFLTITVSKKIAMLKISPHILHLSQNHLREQTDVPWAEDPDHQAFAWGWPQPHGCRSWGSWCSSLYRCHLHRLSAPWEGWGSTTLARCAGCRHTGVSARHRLCSWLCDELGDCGKDRIWTSLSHCMSVSMQAHGTFIGVSYSSQCKCCYVHAVTAKKPVQRLNHIQTGKSQFLF